ncbi:MAG: hypothetical protein ACRC35_08915 [Angustibacter sp.]
MEVRTLRYRDHEFSVTAESTDHGSDVTLVVDGHQRRPARSSWRDPVWKLHELDLGLDLDALGLAGGRIVAESSWRSGRLSRCDLLLRTSRLTVMRFGKPERIPFVPAEGTRAYDRYRWRQAHPRLYAGRHLAGAAAKIVVGILSYHVTVSFLSWGWLPTIPFPDIPWLVAWSPSGWLATVMGFRDYWAPVVVAVLAGAVEYRRRRRRARAEQEVAEQTGHSLPSPRGES